MREDEQTYYTWYGQYVDSLEEGAAKIVIEKGLAEVFGLVKVPEETDEQFLQRVKTHLRKLP